MKKPIYHHLPNTITMLSLVSGCTAIIFSFDPVLVHFAPWMVVFSALFDFMDGFTARMLKAYSELGKQLDSLADAVSFGVAPAMIAFQIIRQIILTQDASFSFTALSFQQFLMLLPALVFPVFSVLRLARFNLDSSQTLSFKGLPTPGSALVIVFLSLTYYGSSGSADNVYHTAWFFPITLLFLGYLMISPIRMLSLKFSTWNLRDNYLKYLLLLAGIVLVPFWGIPGCLYTLVAYLFLSLVFHFTAFPKS